MGRCPTGGRQRPGTRSFSRRTVLKQGRWLAGAVALVGGGRAYAREAGTTVQAPRHEEPLVGTWRSDVQRP